MTRAYPRPARERDRWILALRPPRPPLDPFKPYGFFLEEERAEDGRAVPVATVLLTNRECPWRCLMCDLWKNTLEESVPLGAIPAQIDLALDQLSPPPAPPPRQIKLYNSGSFFDPRAIPPGDHGAIADRVRKFDRVVVECHPALVGPSAVEFHGLLGTKLEVAMGLETAHPDVLERLNKRMTLEQFARASRFLREHDIAVRVFILVQPPFMDAAEALDWAKRSVEFAFECGASVVSLIPTRTGNGALEELDRQGAFSPPRIELLEAALAHGISLRRGRVFADLWDLEKFSTCNACFADRWRRLRGMNLTQVTPAPVSCPRCRPPA